MLSMYSIGNDLYTGRKSLNIIGKRRLWFAIALVFIAISLVSFVVKEPNLGIEFRGGSQFTVSQVSDTSHDPAYKVIAEEGNDDAPRVATVGDSAVRVQTSELDDQQTQAVKTALAEAYGVSESDVTSTFIGPSWGQDILAKAIRAMVIFMALISIVLTVYFRSWTIAAGAIGALLHDFVVTLGVYWILGFEVTPATIIGLLTIMGYSLYDTVVVFDKVRENTAELTEQLDVTYEESANLAVNQTLIRSLNTSLTGLLPVIAVLVIGVWMLGADTLRDLALVMFVGMLLSTISSIVVAAPLAVWLALRNPQIREHTNEVLSLREDHHVEKAASATPEKTNLATVEVVPGGHKGQRAQPQRKKKRKKR
ncbi:MAG: protein translocase subunit SecF [Actinomycetaceae bacterium]|nr:protein translocase subunit SecF [Actinomycetaceae bacterium]